MERSVPWEFVLHNLTRTEERRNYRFSRDHVLGVELDAIVSHDNRDPSYEARAARFLEREGELLDAYYTAPKGRQRRRLQQRIARALVTDELLEPEHVDRFMKLSPRRRPKPRRRRPRKEVLAMV